MENKPMTIACQPNRRLPLKRWIFGPALAMILLTGLWSCASTHKSARKTLKTEGFTLTYLDQAQAGSAVRAFKLQHPLKLTERQMLFHLVALRYENYSLLGKPGPVFTTDDIKKIKRLLTKALNHVHSRNIIGFNVKSEDGATSGQLFASKGHLHWRFDEIRGVKYSLTRNKMARYGTAWRMVPSKGQKLHLTDKLLGAHTKANWIVAKIDLPPPSNLKTRRSQPEPAAPKKAEPAASPNIPAPPAPSAPGAASPSPGKSTADLEEKLKFLKHLYENQLIDDKEYEKKRQDLLDQYL